MKYIKLPSADSVRRLSFYLAMEEYVARHIDVGDCFFMWQVEPSVIFGRNQLIEAEVNLEYCRRHHIQTYRRKSGGGCVYADMSNLMFSYITKEENVNFTFNRYIMMVVHMLQRLGVDARASGRNDVMIGDRKVSGNAFYRLPDRSIVHGTMLYDTDMLNMVGAITPTDAKLLSKGVQSVRQRICLLKDYISLTLDEFRQFAHETLCDGDIMLTADDVRAIEELEQEYLSPEFIYGNNPRYTVIKKRHIEGVGELEARIELKNNIIKSVNLMGDYFLISDVDSQLLNKLKGVPLERGALRCILPDRIDDVIMNLYKEDFIDLLTQ
jgi:lipoyltransferase/lipoate-protein ligase